MVAYSHGIQQHFFVKKGQAKLLPNQNHHQVKLIHSHYCQEFHRINALSHAVRDFDPRD